MACARGAAVVVLVFCCCFGGGACALEALVSFHGGGGGSGGVNNVLRYALPDGSLRGALFTGSLRELRGLALWRGGVLVANAWKHDSCLVFANSSRADAQPPVVVAPAGVAPLLVHPYGLAVDAAGAMFVAAQDTDALLAASAAHFPHLELMASLAQPRGVAAGGGRVFAASRDGNSVTAFDAASRKPLRRANVTAPIGVALSPDAATLFVGSETANAVLALDAHSLAVQRTYRSASGLLQHPAGLAVTGAALYVLSHDTNSLLRFECGAAEGAEPTVVLRGLPDTPEQLLLLT